MKSIFKNKNVFITGASGFIGSWMCSMMFELGANVYGTITKNSNPFSAYNLLDLSKKVAMVSIDIKDYMQIHNAFTSIKPDIIIHLAALGSVPRSLSDPLDTFYVNSFGTLNILECCRKLHLKGKLLIASTDLAFGTDYSSFPELCGHEEDKNVSFSGPYGTSKSVMELITRCYKHSFSNSILSISIIRCANVFGYGDVTERRVIPLFINSSIKKGTIPLKYRDNGRQFLYITDVIIGYLQIIKSLEETQGRDSLSSNDVVPTYHFALEKYPSNNKPYISMIDLAKLVSDKLGSNIDMAHSIAYAPNECKIQSINCSKTRSTLNWKPQKTLSEGIDLLCEWYKILNSEIHNRNNVLGKLLRKTIEEISSNF